MTDKLFQRVNQAKNASQYINSTYTRYESMLSFVTLPNKPILQHCIGMYDEAILEQPTKVEYLPVVVVTQVADYLESAMKLDSYLHAFLIALKIAEHNDN